MINILIDKSGKTSKENIFLGNQHENLDETLHFSFPKEYDNFYKYITYSYSNNNQRVTGISPLVDDNFIITSKITKCAGVWELNLICKISPVNLDDKVIDLTENNSTKEHIFISNTISACVSGNSVDVESFNNVAVDENIASLYDSVLALKNKVEENDKAHEENEAVRKANELERQEAENTRQLNENTRISAEQSRIEAENTRKSNETVRQSKESARTEAETNRDSAEVKRASAENKRVETETARQSAEAVRVSEENKRISAEANRANTEKERVSAETSRKQAESARVSAETARTQTEANRVENEKLRVSAERAREQAEQSRVNAESQRSINEATRESAERARIEAETARVTAENERVNAETLRVKAENERSGVITKLREDLDNNTKADGRTQRSLSVLWALNNGISYRFETDSEKAYQKQILSGAKLGAVNTIGGRTIVYNQLFTELSETGSNGVTGTYVDNVITLNGTATNNWINFSALPKKLDVVSKFYIKMTILKNNDNVNFHYSWLNRKFSTGQISSGTASVIYNQTMDDLKKGNTTGIAGFNSGTKFNDVKLKIMIVNLTQMFGAGNEPSTTEEFEAMFPEDYYPYNEGELMSMSINEVKEQGKNYFDFSKVPQGSSFNTDADKVTVDYSKQTITIPSKTYYASTNKTLRELCPNIMPGTYTFSMNRSNAESGNVIFLYNSKGSISLNKPTTLTNSDFDGLVVFYNSSTSENDNVISNIQVEKASTATTYSPYRVNSYAIPQAILNLEGYGWGVNNVYNYVDFDNKKYYKYVGRVDLGTINYSFVNYGNDDEFQGFRFVPPKDIKTKDDNVGTDLYKIMGNLLCYKYQTAIWEENYQLGMDKTISRLSNAIQINDSSYSDPILFKHSLQGVYLYYELAEPIITDISDIIGDTFQEPFKVEGGSSITFKNTNGDGYRVPISSDVQYVVSLKEVTS